MSYQILAVVDIPAPTKYFPCMTKCVGEYVIAEFEDFPKDHTEIIGAHLEEMKLKLAAAGYEAEIAIHNKGNCYEFGEVDVRSERAIIRTLYEYES